jgi:hypothetical protein
MPSDRPRWCSNRLASRFPLLRIGFNSYVSPFLFHYFLSFPHLDLEDEMFRINTHTALRKLGVDPKSMMQRYVVCPDCFNMTPYDELYPRETAECQALRYKESQRAICGSTLYTEQAKARTPLHVMPITPMSVALQYLFQDKEFVGNLQ